MLARRIMPRARGRDPDGAQHPHPRLRLGRSSSSLTASLIRIAVTASSPISVSGLAEPIPRTLRQ
jgi:hypothetical protein